MRGDLPVRLIARDVVFVPVSASRTPELEPVNPEALSVLPEMLAVARFHQSVPLDVAVVLLFHGTPSPLLSETVGTVVASRLVAAYRSRSPTATVGMVIVWLVVGFPVGIADATCVIATTGHHGTVRSNNPDATVKVLVVPSGIVAVAPRST
jgi:hypothetical protein